MAKGQLLAVPADKIVGETIAQYRARKDAGLLEAVAFAGVGDRLKFREERLAYTIQARDKRYLICSKPFNARRTVLYCIVDTLEKRRGPENLVFGFGAETRRQCREMLGRLVTGQSEISYRRALPLDVQRVYFLPREGASA